MEYDEKKITTSSQWPQSIISDGGLGKDASAGDAEYLIDYSNTQLSFTVDDSGYISTRIDWIEGNTDIRMPLAMWDEVKDKTHPFHPDHRFTVAYEVKDGSITSYSEDGSTIATTPLPVNPIRVDVENLNIDSLLSIFGGGYSSDSSNARLATILDRYESIGASVQHHGESEILVNLPTSSNSGGQSTKLILNSVTGLVNRRAIYNSQGDLDALILNSYDLLSEMILPVQIITYDIGLQQNGDRGILTKTVQTRTNVSIQHRSNEG